MAIDLTKKAEKVGIVLTKRGINNIPCQVRLAIDKSGSMQGLYDDGTVQAVVERVLAIAMKVDKDGVVDVWGFHNDSMEAPSAQVDTIEGYVNREIVKRMSWGGTSYAPVMEAIVEGAPDEKPAKKGLFGGLFGGGTKAESKTIKNESPDDPILAILITDGENDDRRSAEAVIRDNQDKNIYWQLVGIGRANFSFIEQMGDKYPNCGFVAINDISRISDEDLFEGLLNEEFAEWVKKFA